MGSAKIACNLQRAVLGLIAAAGISWEAYEVALSLLLIHKTSSPGCSLGEHWLAAAWSWRVFSVLALFLVPFQLWDIFVERVDLMGTFHRMRWHLPAHHEMAIVNLCVRLPLLGARAALAVILRWQGASEKDLKACPLTVGYLPILAALVACMARAVAAAEPMVRLVAKDRSESRPVCSTVLVILLDVLLIGGVSAVAALWMLEIL